MIEFRVNTDLPAGEVVVGQKVYTNMQDLLTDYPRSKYRNSSFRDLDITGPYAVVGYGEFVDACETWWKGD